MEVGRHGKRSPSLTAYRYVRPPTVHVRNVTGCETSAAAATQRFWATRRRWRMPRCCRFRPRRLVETERPVMAIGRRQIAQRFFLAERHRGAAVDHRLGVERGETMDERCRLAVRRCRLRHPRRPLRLERISLIERVDRRLLRDVHEQAARHGGGFENSGRCRPLADFQIGGAAAQFVARRDPLGPQAERCAANSSRTSRASMPTRNSAVATLV